MGKIRSDRQPDLFGSLPEAQQVVFVPSEEFLAGIRTELNATLARVTAAQRLPWSDLTQSMLGEMHFHSIAKYLPEAEAKSLSERFEVEIARLYAAEDAA